MRMTRPGRRAEGELQAPAGVNQVGGQIHELLHHSAQTPALGLMPRWCILAEQTLLADPTQQVGGELARGQPLAVEVGLKLAMELLRGAMIVSSSNQRLVQQPSSSISGSDNGGPCLSMARSVTRMTRRNR
jgi:hypothetical protein